MRRTAKETVVQFLRFSEASAAVVDELTTFSQQRWNRTLGWLDDAGLAFYFLQKLKSIQRTDALPTWVVSSLEQRFAANQQRVSDLARRFAVLNQKFTDAGLRYAVLKGFSLIPEFCPDANLRHLGDLDYLVDEESLSAAQQVLIEAGYAPKLSSTPQEFMFVLPGTEPPPRSAQQYSALVPHAVELHLDIWDRDQHRLPALSKLFSVERVSSRQWNGSQFPALEDDDAFLLQVLHACHHLFTYWIRMSSLFEIGLFLNQRAYDSSLWRRVERRAGDNTILREFVVVITELAGQLFGAPVPYLVGSWGRRIRPATRVWVENYAKHCAFCDVPAHEFCLAPKAKLILFLHRQYQDPSTQKHLVRDRLVADSRLSRIVSSLRNKPSLLLERGWWKHHLLVRRSLFHALAGLRYICEIPRWQWLNRAKMRSTAIEP